MYPILFAIPLIGLKVHTYGVMVALGAIAGILWVRYEAEQRGQDPVKAMDLVFYMILAAFIGARLLHILVTERERLLSNPLILFKIWEGGLVFYGALIGGLSVGLWLFRRWRLPMLVYLDILAPAISITHAIGRLGCFFAGCCYGRVVHGNPWYAMTFPDDPRSFAPPGIPLYPTQLMESAGEVLTFLFLVLIVRRFRRRDGQVFAVYLIIYSILRATIELFRGDSERGFVIDPWLSTSQFISIVIFVVGLVLFLHRDRAAKAAAAMVIAVFVAAHVGCSRPLLRARVHSAIDYRAESFTASANDVYYALRSALRETGYTVAEENLTDGVITTTWRPTTSDSHYVLLFDRRDYVPAGAYHQLEIHIAPDGDRTRVEVGSRIKALAAGLKSSGSEEQRLLAATATALRKEEPTITNLGLDE